MWVKTAHQVLMIKPEGLVIRVCIQSALNEFQLCSWDQLTCDRCFTLTRLADLSRAKLPFPDYWLGAHSEVSE